MFHDGNFDQSECTMLMHLPKSMRIGGLRNPQTSAQLSGMDPGPHNGVGPGGVGKIRPQKLRQKY